MNTTIAIIGAITALIVALGGAAGIRSIIAAIRENTAVTVANTADHATQTTAVTAAIGTIADALPAAQASTFEQDVEAAKRVAQTVRGALPILAELGSLAPPDSAVAKDIAKVEDVAAAVLPPAEPVPENVTPITPAT